MHSKLAKFFSLTIAVVITSSSPALAVGAIEGAVVYPWGEPVESFRVHLYDTVEHRLRISRSGRDGRYLMENLDPGTYLVVISDPDLVDQIYGGLACEGPVSDDSCPNVDLGEPVEVVDGATVSGIDFTIDRLGVFTGRVTVAQGADVPFGTSIVAYAATGISNGSRASVGSGTYTVTGLTPGAYILTATGDDIVDEIYDNVPCRRDTESETCTNRAEGQAIEVAINESSEVDFVVDLAGSIAGRATDAATGEPIDRLPMEAWDALGFRRSTGETDADGTYQLLGLHPGIYTVTTANTPSRNGYNDELYDDLPCRGGGSSNLCEVTLGTPITVRAAEETSSIDFALRSMGGIAGKVTSAIDGEPLSRAIVQVYDSQGRRVQSERTGQDGTYLVRGLIAGRYYADASISGFQRRFVGETYDNVLCPPSGPCHPQLIGTPITVARDTIVEGIDMALDLGGSISGRVTDAASGEPIADRLVIIWAGDDQQITNVRTDENGLYTAPFSDGLLPGTYYATVLKGFEGRLGEVYGGPYCPFSPQRCQPSRGTPIPVELRSEVQNIDFTLDFGGSISGTVTSDDGSSAFSVRAWDQQGREVGSGGTDAEGRYVIRGLAPGSYFVSAWSVDHRGEVWDAHLCSPTNFLCNHGSEVAIGDPVPVEIATTTENIDFALEQLGSIAGRVTHLTTGEPLGDLEIRVWRDDGAVRQTTSAPDGRYEVGTLLSGTYFVTVGDDDVEWIHERFDDQFCVHGYWDCDFAEGTPIQVDLGEVSEEIDFALLRGGTVSGMLTDAAGQPTGERGSITIWRPTGEFVGSGRADEAGRYVAQSSIRPLAPGPYYLRGWLPGYIYEFYDNVKCPGGDLASCDLDLATRVHIEAETDTPGIDIALDPGGDISGTLRHALTGQPIRDDVVVWARDASGKRVVPDYSSGFYQIRGLPPGTYYVTTESTSYEDQLYPDLDCPDGECDVTAGIPVSVTLEQPVEGIDFQLVPEGVCGTAEVLCLGGDRFQVRVDWRDPSRSDTATGVRLTNDAGYFWFFDPDNIELVIKLVDACVEPFDRYWVFAAGLTDVEVEITVLDTETRRRWTHTNPQGLNFAPVLDTDAFATCDAAPSPSAGRGFDALRPILAELWHDRFKTSSCGGDGLCFGDGRFRVEADWQTPDGDSGTATAVGITDAAGYFWFFGPDNIEVVVKVLDACGPFDRFWVFAAGLTDVEVALRVTDLETGETKNYFHPAGSSFQPIFDTNAFATCP